MSNGGGMKTMHRRKQWALRGIVLTVFTLALCISIVAQGQVALPGGDCRVEVHQSWSDVEKWVWDRLCVGEIADLGERDNRSLDPHSNEGWDDERRLSPRFLETILLHERWASAVPRQGVRIKGALFDALIDLDDGRIEHPLWLSDSRFTEPVNLRYIETRSYVSFTGSNFLRQLKLNSAIIDIHLDMTDVKVSGKLNMDSATIGASLYMRDGAEFADVNLLSAEIGGQLDMTDVKVSGKLYMGSATIGASLYMRDGAEFADVNLLSAEIGDQLDMTGVKVSGTLQMSLATIGASLYMRDGQFDKQIEAVFLHIGRSLDLRGAELSGLDLTGAHIEGELRLATPDWEPTWQDGAHFILHNTAVDAIQDTSDAWPKKLDLDGFVYRTLGGYGGEYSITDRGMEWYVNWLARDEPYTPQPYEQLAGVLSRMGHGKEASDVLYAGRERARAKAKADGHFGSWARQTALNYTIGYGLGGRYFWSIYWVIGLVLLGTLWLRRSGQHRVVDQDGKPPMKLGFFYSLDMLLPIIRLRQRHYEVDLQGSVRYYFYFHHIMGYVLASFLIAGLSGLTK